MLLKVLIGKEYIANYIQKLARSNLMSNNQDTAKKIAAVFGILCIVLAAIIILMIANIIPVANSNVAPRLVNVGMGGRDNPNQHSLQIIGYVCNTGLQTAYKTQVHVVGVYTTGGVAIDTYVPIGNGQVIYGQGSTFVDAAVSYSADGLGSWTITPIWENSP